MTDDTLLAQIDDFLAKTGMKPTRFGIDTLGDGGLVRQLREGGRSLTLKSAGKVIEFMENYRPDQSAAA